MTCSECGANRTADRCNICEVLESGQAYDGVEACRANKPSKSLGAKVHHSQRQEAADYARKMGVPTYFDREGHPEFESRAHKAKYLKIVGMVNRDGGYGD